MARRPKPWYRKARKSWFVMIAGVQHNLGPDKSEAYERFHRLMRQPKRQKVSPESLPAIADAFLDWTERNRSEATYGWYRERLQAFVSRYPDLPIHGLRPHHVESWAAEKPCRSPTTRRNLMRAVKRCLGWAVSQGYLEANPVDQLEMPGAVARETYVSPEAFERMLSFVPPCGFRDLLVVAYETGCRPQELLRVEGRHVDLGNSRWVFPSSESKGRKLPRVVYLNDAAKEATERAITRGVDGRLFRNAAGKPWNKDSVGCAFDRLRIRLGHAVMEAAGEEISDDEIAAEIVQLSEYRVSRGQRVAKTAAELRCEAKRKLRNRRARQLVPSCSLYALRHSWATNALKRGVDALTVAILMGHKDPSTLARTYQHLAHDPAHLLEQARRATG